MELAKNKFTSEAEQLKELYHLVGTARSIVKSVASALREPTPDIPRVLRHSEAALLRLQTALSEIQALMEKKPQC